MITTTAGIAIKYHGIEKPDTGGGGFGAPVGGAIVIGAAAIEHCVASLHASAPGPKTWVHAWATHA